jgi:hypothetical protein
MILMLRSIYPIDKAAEVTRVFVKSAIKKLPPFLKALGIYLGPSEKGIKAYSIYEVEDEKMADGLRELTKIMAAYSQVQGYKWWIEPVVKSRDAMTLMGVSPPK